MPILEIGPHGSPLVSLDLDTGHGTFRTDSNQVDGVLVLRELDHVSFSVSEVRHEDQLQIFIGDLSADDLFGSEVGSGNQLADRRVWFERAYFESARGHTRLRVEVERATGWESMGSCRLYIVPSKMSETEYHQMEAELKKIGSGLLLDLLGKSTRTYDRTTWPWDSSGRQRAWTSSGTD